MATSTSSGLDTAPVCRTETDTFVSYDGGIKIQTEYQRPDRYRTIEAELGGLPRIARGGGYSYAAASFGEGILVQDLSRFNRIISFDPAARLIEVEAGLRIDELLSFTVPRGLWLPQLPGYPRITIGGCVAANVHGKHPARHGTFTRSVVDLTIFHPRYGTRRVAPDDDPATFELTCGGVGLTGLIVSVTLRLEPLKGHTARVTRTPVASLLEGLELMRDAAARSEFVYSIHNAGPSPRTFGRGCIVAGEVLDAEPPLRFPRQKFFDLTAAKRSTLPVSVWGGPGTPVLQWLYWKTQLLSRGDTRESLFDFAFPFARKWQYFLLYGDRGLAEYQVIIPQGNLAGYLDEVQQLVTSHALPGVMCSMKFFGGNQRFLRFERDGVCVTLDLARDQAALSALPRLDELTIAAGGIPNIIKDSRLPRDVVKRCYPEYELLREELSTYDPERLYRSELSERLGL
jgi:decaprenylphospho-beta-D-ribofuranose 2-oxidase